MKRTVSLILVLWMLLSVVVMASAANGLVVYDGNAREFVFTPGSEYSPTDLFPDFKDVMPGDRLTQQITLRNDASNQTQAKIYFCSRGAHPGSGEFLSKLRLQVQVRGEAEGSLFDAPANEAVPLVDWVCLGTLQPGGEVDLDVILSVPVELDNTYSEQIGYLDWYFKVEEYPLDTPAQPGEDETPEDGETPTVKPDGEIPGGTEDGKTPGSSVSDDEDAGGKNAGGQTGSDGKNAGGQIPYTGDLSNLGLWLAILGLSAGMIVLLLVLRKKDRKNKE